MLSSSQLAGGLASVAFVVVNQESNTTWNCGETFWVTKFLTKATLFWQWMSETPKYCPLCERGFHLGKLCPSCNFGARTYTGQSRGTKVPKFAIWSSLTPCQSSCVAVWSLLGKRLNTDLGRSAEMQNLWSCEGSCKGRFGQSGSLTGTAMQSKGWKCWAKW